jgi:hypothetical protein
LPETTKEGNSNVSSSSKSHDQLLNDSQRNHIPNKTEIEIMTSTKLISKTIPNPLKKFERSFSSSSPIIFASDDQKRLNNSKEENNLEKYSIHHIFPKHFDITAWNR